MEKQEKNNIRLGLFVMAALLLLIVSFYTIGKNNTLFGPSFKLRARFSNLNGLIAGNNVLFSGIQAGTVKNTELINDSTIEVTFLINNKIKNHIHKNALAWIGTEGLMGNKIVNISPGIGSSKKVESGDLICSKKIINTDELMQSLSATTSNVAILSETLKNTALRISHSEMLNLLDDPQLGKSIKLSLNNFNQTTKNARLLTQHLNALITQTKNGEGLAGVLLADTAAARELKETLTKIRSASTHADQLSAHLNELMKGLNNELSNGKGSFHLLFKDTVTANNLKLTIENARKSTDSFNQNMEALKHNFLFRGYFKKQKNNSDTSNKDDAIRH